MATVYLTGKFSPSNQDWDQGQVTKVSTGVYVDSAHFQNTRTFYPYDKVQSIKE